MFCYRGTRLTHLFIIFFVRACVCREGLRKSEHTCRSPVVFSIFISSSLFCLWILFFLNFTVIHDVCCDHSSLISFQPHHKLSSSVRPCSLCTLMHSRPFLSHIPLYIMYFIFFHFSIIIILYYSMTYL